ncbi:MAG: dTMP kinase [Pegethrix bostrychoides GSE-TBD4-15B]|jgi:dTMP kinase|uniref:Thymidylate kinase n=1 Tax=Pegethrix bostrychoides GSE-TBD4-15B TaxID=2839662 RepID=A0A951PBD3_9CYAN|nr:dTMP kinase [Pegethrix bostrychoides GSE-TBD4-15B]
MSGKFIVFEGVEGSGKTTQIQQIQSWLQRCRLLDPATRIVTTREPGGTALGQQLRQILLQSTDDLIQDRTELLLYAADRAQHVEAYLKPLLAAGAIVLCDRYTDSTVAYQGYGRQLDQILIEQLNQIATGGLVSDLTFWLDVEVELGLERAQGRAAHDRIERADLSFHRRVQQGFTQLAAAHPQRIVRIDASLSPEAVSQQIQQVLQARLQDWYGIEFA